MPEIVAKGGQKHYGAYPPGPVSPLLAYAFRPFFLLLGGYLVLSVVLWGLTLGRVFPLLFLGDPFAWHIYEMIFGAGSAAITAFILTAVPEFYIGHPPYVGRKLAYLVAFWILGRVAFWCMKWVGIGVVMATNLPFLIWVAVLVAEPILNDPQRRNVNLFLTLIVLLGIQGWYLIAMTGWLMVNPLQILRVGLGGFMVLELLALRRITTESINEWFEEAGIDEIFLARPPRYNLAVLCVTLYTACEFFMPGNTMLGWLGLATAAALLNILNDFFMEDIHIVHKPQVTPLFLVILLMAVGYGAMGFDHLHDGFHAIHHLRHFLTSGVIGTSYLAVMVLVSNVHTGRVVARDWWMDSAMFLLLVGTLLRVFAFMAGGGASTVQMVAAVVWAVPFVVFLVRFQRILRSPRADGLPG